MSAAEISSSTDIEPGSGALDLVLMDDQSGAIIALTFSGGPRASLARIVVFIADGVTLWYDADIAPARHRPDISWSVEGATQHIKLMAHTAEDLSCAEHRRDGDAEVQFRVPLTADLTLEPNSQPVPRMGDSSENVLQGSRNYRVTGSFAPGSVVYAISGQAWIEPGDFGASTNQAGVRLQAAFQDGSAMLVACPDTADGSAGSNGAGGHTGAAALQAQTDIALLAVSALRTAGAERSAPQRMICQLRGRTDVTVLGGLRSPDQHLALVRPSEDGDGWVRRAFTPFDFVRSGVTGFGILEQVTQVSTREPVAVRDAGLPDPY
ncbi:hypothetical protein SAMN05892883_1590 [Jatrophihabitans sp. GAS493]|uniref:hypothetical protein n=1 Tax=Jatrophihabitans sp. GAS493 TaxID=1907575 RepID=UPI000BC00AAD|nr:hypothetical protein [Jatrophihabitans sp. GAS493]SOD72166.1 hypothetical protein SAMN05892883_1590 [Jatrophihabitans sp. GAS493]